MAVVTVRNLYINAWSFFFRAFRPSLSLYTPTCTHLCREVGLRTKGFNFITPLMASQPENFRAKSYESRGGGNKVRRRRWWEKMYSEKKKGEKMPEKSEKKVNERELRFEFFDKITNICSFFFCSLFLALADRVYPRPLFCRRFQSVVYTLLNFLIRLKADGEAE